MDDRDSFEDFSAEEMIVMADNIDNLNLDQEHQQNHDEEPCKSLIVTNVDGSVFVDELAKADFESSSSWFQSQILPSWATLNDTL